MDLSKLSPAPWKGEDWRVYGNNRRDLVGSMSLCPYTENAQAHCELIALDRNAFDILMRRGWRAEKAIAGWCVGDLMPRNIVHNSMAVERELSRLFFEDPFTALVEGEAWYKANVECTIES